MGRVLSHTLVVAPGTQPRARLFVLHGVFGAGRNWATVARRVTEARRDWGAVLVDLRLHGASQGFAPPHTVAACADDLVALAGAIDGSAHAVLGHSLGGKVALAYLAARPPGLRQVWVVDADPSPVEPRGDAWDLLRIIRALPLEFHSRDDLVAGLGRAGVDRRTAEWMATNLDHTQTGYRWRLDFFALEQLLADFSRADLWHSVEQVPPGVELHFVKAARSHVISERSLGRLGDIAGATGRVVVHEVEGGHWLNADNPDAIVALLGGRLPECA
ncbi:MAG TPA: alpha/beta hydrolase [bacterium]|nr:alpha/beta hydrolase [bacterium]